MAVVAMVFGCALFAAAQSQPATQPKTDRAKTGGTSNDQRSAAPPLQVTVTAPQRTPEERQADKQRADRQDATNDRMAAANETIANLTIWLVVVGRRRVQLWRGPQERGYSARSKEARG
jgi:hypothetical protein